MKEMILLAVFSHTHISPRSPFSAMADQENKRFTRLAKRRAMEAIELQLQPAKRNRVVLGEISNNVTIPSDRVKIQKSKSKSKKLKNIVESSESVPEKFTDPQMYETYVSDIYEYLHNMEKEVKRRPMSDYIEKVQKDVSVIIDYH